MGCAHGVRQRLALLPTLFIREERVSNDERLVRTLLLLGLLVTVLPPATRSATLTSQAITFL